MMDMGQITQGLRADVLQQAAGQGINVAQMMESGVSFADIMMMILQNTQSIANGQGIPEQNILPQMGHQAKDENTNQSADMSESNGMTFMPDMKNLMPNILNIQNSVDNSLITKANACVENSEELNLKPVVSEDVDVSNPLDLLNCSTVEAADNLNKTDGISDVNPDISFSDLKVNVEKQELSKDVHTDNLNVISNKNVSVDVIDKLKVTDNKNLDNIGETDTTPAVNPFLEITNEITLEQSSENNNVNYEYDVVNTHENLQIINDLPTIDTIWKMTQNVQQQSKPMENIHVQQMHFVDAQNQTVENPISQKLSDILGIISPELLKTSENMSSNNKFIMDLLSEISTEAEIKDSFDISESILKVDPMQLAGLLDFISTGNGIPQAMDIPHSDMLKNIETAGNVKSSADKMIFDPEEMIKSGEMEIVSYTPAPKNNDSSMSQYSGKQADENAIDHARTMKSVKETVKENVKTEIFEDTAKISEASASMSTLNPDDLVQKVDISFERAFAELEMNKAKYGSADEQLYKGISENLEKGRSEFTVKLRPEGLGEILVKLVSDEGGKAVLTLVASSEKTAELLNRDLATLQTTLNQHNVEIENNNVKTTETVMQAQTAFDQYNERQQDEANQQHHFRKLKKKIGDISDKNASFDTESEMFINADSDSALNIKI